jgi:hypothetical protein
MNGLSEQQPSLISDNADSDILANQVELNKNRKDFLNLFICLYTFSIKKINLFYK